MLNMVAVILLVFGLIVLAGIFLLVRLLTGGRSGGLTAEESLLIQDTIRTLERLENRVDVLETLLAENLPASGGRSREE